MRHSLIIVVAYSALAVSGWTQRTTNDGAPTSGAVVARDNAVSCQKKRVTLPISQLLYHCTAFGFKTVQRDCIYGDIRRPTTSKSALQTNRIKS